AVDLAELLEDVSRAGRHRGRRDVMGTAGLESLEIGLLDVGVDRFESQVGILVRHFFSPFWMGHEPVQRLRWPRFAGRSVRGPLRGRARSMPGPIGAVGPRRAAANRGPPLSVAIGFLSDRMEAGDRARSLASA